MAFLRKPLISTVAFFGLIGAAATPSNITDIDQFSFVNMQNDSTISISYTSAGCFHYDSGVMTFTPETMSYKGDTRIVNFSDMASLDKYFRSLSAKQGKFGGCTSSTDLTLTLNRDGEAIETIRLIDDFCFREKGMLAPNALKYKLFDKEDTEQLTLIEK